MDLVVDQIGVLCCSDPAAVEVAVVVGAEARDVDAGFCGVWRPLSSCLSVHGRGLSLWFVVAALLLSGGSGGERLGLDDAGWV